MEPAAQSISEERSAESSDAVPSTSAPSSLAWWHALPARYKIVSATMLSFVICNLDKVVMSVSIIPMAQDFGWSSSVSGLVQSSFFWGYLLAQLPGGALIKQLGGRRVLPVGVAGFSVATAMLPLVASTVPGLCLSRSIVGAGESIAPSAATDMVARIVPPHERSRAVSFIFSGLHFGSILGLLATPVLIAHFDWEASFVCFGMLGVAWTLWFEHLMTGLSVSDPEVMQALVSSDPASPSSSVSSTSSLSMASVVASARSVSSAAAWAKEAAVAPQQQAGRRMDGSSSARRSGGDLGSTSGGSAAVVATGNAAAIPWRAFLRSRSVQVLMFTHFCNNWLHYTFMAWLPTFFTDTLSVDLMHASQTALLPPLAGVAASALAGPLADELISRKVPVPLVRKAAQGIAFLAPTACLATLFNQDIMNDPTLTVAAITAALGLSSFSLAGLYCTHQDLSPRYASTLLGLTNTAGAVPGIVGVTVVGYLFDATHSWELSLMLPSVVLLVAGALVYSFMGTHEPVDFDSGDNSPLPIESLWGEKHD